MLNKQFLEFYNNMQEKLIQYNFNKAANTYLNNKNIQISAANKIESYLLNNSLQQNLILDFGSGPGTFKNISQTILYDLSISMLKIGKNQSKINGNATNLPFANQVFPIIASNLMIQWITDKNQMFEEVYRTLQDNGTFIYTTLISESLWQLNHAFGKIDDKVHTLNFISENEYFELANKNNFKVVYKNIWEDTLFFNDILSLLMHFKLTGTNIPKSNCNKGLGGKKIIEQLANTYPQIKNLDAKINSNSKGRYIDSTTPSNSKYPLTYKFLFMVLQK